MLRQCLHQEESSLWSEIDWNLNSSADTYGLRELQSQCPYQKTDVGML